MAKKREIIPVQNREEKRQAYQNHLRQYRNAIRNEFYFEAILIDYACLEDRLRYMLYYLGVIQNEQDHKITAPRSARVRAFRSILQRYTGSRAQMKIDSISGKSNIVRSIFIMVSDENIPKDTSKTEDILRTKLNRRERADLILKLLDDIGKWCGYRNEIIHSLMNKNLDSLNAHISEKAEEGFHLFRQLDNQVQWVKRKNIRKTLKLKD